MLILIRTSVCSGHHHGHHNQAVPVFIVVGAGALAMAAIARRRHLAKNAVAPVDVAQML